jgi:hypothetical protein
MPPKPPFFLPRAYLQPIVNNVEIGQPPWIVERRAVRRPGEAAGARACSRCPACEDRAYEVESGVTTFHPRDAGRHPRPSQGFIPGGASAPWLYEEHLDVVLPRRSAIRPSCSVRAVVVMDDHRRQARAWPVVLRPSLRRARRAARGNDPAGEDPPASWGRAGPRTTCCSTCRQHLGLCGRPCKPPSARSAVGDRSSGAGRASKPMPPSGPGTLPAEEAVVDTSASTAEI